MNRNRSRKNRNRKVRRRIILIFLLILAGLFYFQNSRSDSFAHTFDLRGKMSRMTQPLEDADYFELKIEDESQEKLKYYLENRTIRKKKVIKKWVGVELLLDGRYQNAKLKYHGTSATHFWNKNNKNSYTIKLNSDSTYWDNYRRFKLIIGEEADPRLIAVNQLANKLGLISPYGQMKMLQINGENKGHYYFVEDLKKEYLERELGITNYAILINITDWSRKEYFETRVQHISDNDLYSGHLESKKKPLHAKAINRYDILSSQILNRDIKAVKESIDVDYMAKFLACATVFNDIHFLTGDNLRLLYDFSRGKFYPIYRAESGGRDIDTNFSPTFPNFNKFLFYSLGDEYAKSINVEFFRLLLTDNEIRHLRDKYINELVSDPEYLVNSIRQTHKDNAKIMLHSDVPRRVNKKDINDQLNIVTRTSGLAKEYLNYGHIYGSYDSISHHLNVLLDSYSPIHLSYPNSGFKAESKVGIEFDIDFKPSYIYHDFDIEVENFNPKNLVFVNATTGDTISRKKVYINYMDQSDVVDTRTSLETLDENNIRYSINKDTLTIKQGNYFITSNVKIEFRYTTVISAGVTFNLGKDINFSIHGNVDIKGNEYKEVMVKSTKKDENFGCFAILGKDSNSYAKIEYLTVSGGSEAFYEGRLYTGQFAVYNSNVTMNECTFENSMGDDGLNIKFSKVSISNSNFQNNLADQVDLDFCFAKIHNCTFSPSQIDANGDGLDLSGSYAEIQACNFTNFLDKGLSLGEKSRVIVDGCSFSNNLNAIAVKDETTLYGWNNLFSENKNDYFSFIKKNIFNTPILKTKDVVQDANYNLIVGERMELNESEYDTEKTRFIQEFERFKASSSLHNKIDLNVIIEN